MKARSFINAAAVAAVMTSIRAFAAGVLDQLHTDSGLGTQYRAPATASAAGASGDARAQPVRQRSKGSALFAQLQADSGLGREYRSPVPR